MSLTYERGLLDWVKLNEHAEYWSQRSFCSKVIVRTHTDTTDRSHDPDY